MTTIDQEAAFEPPNPLVRVNQLYYTYLDTVYECDYYRVMHDSVVGRARHLDFLIGVGTAVSGGSGLGILANPMFAWLCASLTTLSVVLSAAKSAYDWPGRVKAALERHQTFGEISGRLKGIVEDVQYRRGYTPEVESAYLKIRDEIRAVPANPYKEMSEARRRKIQNAIKQRINHKDWWRPR